MEGGNGKEKQKSVQKIHTHYECSQEFANLNQP